MNTNGSFNSSSSDTNEGISCKSQEKNEEEKLFGKKINLRVMGSSLMLVGLAQILDAN